LGRGDPANTEVQAGPAKSSSELELRSAGSPSLLRAINERAVLELIQRRGPLSPAQLSREIALSKPTVYLSVSGLLAAGLIRPAGRQLGGPGPRARLYDVNPSAGWVVGIDVGRQFVRAAIADIAGTVVARREERAQVRSAGRLIYQIGEITHGLAAAAGIDWHQVTQATLGTPGVFRPGKGRVEMAPNLPGWGRRGMVEEVSRQLGTRLTFENDVNLAALGEQAAGLGQGVANFVYLWIGTGVGMGLVLDDHLFRGATGAAGEIAYLPLGPGDPHDPAHRRRGTFEDAAAAGAAAQIGKDLGVAGQLTSKKLFGLARQGLPAALAAVEVEGQRLALGIASVAAVVDPELIILGGGIGSSGDLLIEPIERELRRLTPFRPRLEVSRLGDGAVLLGAIATALTAARAQVFSRGLTRDASAD
jgi:predicted NBD/HSP70 family sugar kinase